MEPFDFGHYVLLRKIAHGGMAEVFLGRDRDDGEDGPLRVIKCILPQLANDPQFLAMFINEAQLAAQMSHPNIVRVFDFGEQAGRLFMVMEYVEGLDCWRFTRRLYPLGGDHTAIAIWITCRILDALEYAHGMTDVNGDPLNVVHRDLSPSNIYLSIDGDVKLGDFGIARIASERYRRVTLIPKGKFGYVAPEQVEGAAIDQRADIFAVGVVLAELLIGKKMFTAASQIGVMLEIKEGRLDKLEENVDRVDPELLGVLRSALARRPEDRYLSARELNRALQEFASRRSRGASRAALASLVRRALDLNDPHSSAPAGAPSATPTTKEVTEPGAFSLAPPTISPTTVGRRRTPVVFGSTSSLAPLDDDGATPITREATPFEGETLYTARLGAGRVFGPASYARMIELICTDDITADTLVSRDGRRYIPAAELPELQRHLPAYTPTADIENVEVPTRKGILSLEAPAEVLLSLAIQGESGLLVCRDGVRRKEVYFYEGRPVYVSSNTPRELLGEYLVSRGAIDRANLELALALLPKFNGHMGDTLIALGVLSVVQLFGYIVDQVKSRFSDLIGWRRGTYEYYKGVSCRPDVLEVNLEPFGMIAEELVRYATQLDAPRAVSEMRQSVVSQASTAGEVLRRVSFPADIDALLRDTLQSHLVADLAEEVGNDALLAKTMYVAIESGIWVLEGPPPLWRKTKAV